MSKLPYVKNYRELVAYQKSLLLARQIFTLTKSFPKEEKYALIDQIRRSSRSVGAQIAEAWGKRYYERHFVSKLTDADAEQYETQHWIKITADCGYLDAKQASELTEKCREIGRLLGGMIAKAELFCSERPKQFSEQAAEYFIEEQ